MVFFYFIFYDDRVSHHAVHLYYTTAWTELIIEQIEMFTCALVVTNIIQSGGCVTLSIRPD